MKRLAIRNMNLEAARPTICSSLYGRKREDILGEVKILAEFSIDLFEWRADRFEDVRSDYSLLEMLDDLRRESRQKPIIFSLRGGQNGGDITLSAEEYIHANELAMDSRQVDLVEIDLSWGEAVLKRLIEKAGSIGIRTIIAMHDFQKTPDKKTIVAAFGTAMEYGADLPKIAVMANHKRDVLTLLDAVLEIDEIYGQNARIVTAMGQEGMVSRIMPAFFGSALTYAFGIGGAVPGQINPNDLRSILNQVSQQHENEKQADGGLR